MRVRSEREQFSSVLRCDEGNRSGYHELVWCHRPGSRPCLTALPRLACRCGCTSNRGFLCLISRLNSKCAHIDEIDSKNIISTGRRTRDTLATNIEAPKIADRVDDDGSEYEGGGKGKEKEAPAKSRTRSSQHMQVRYIEDEGEESGSEEDPDEQGEDVTSENDSEDEYEE
ncbi:hypothetical protein BJV78DRAFT_951407 [Lactifluus subvellereus]|nr:hypothetical protein BJV78DRAFT_951407 [Lactifluus subvellereus]